MRPTTVVALIVACTAAAALAPAVLGPYGLGVALMLCLWIALTQSWTLFSGFSGYISLGHVVFYGLGAYCVVATWQVIPLVLAVPLAGAVAALFAFGVGGLVLRVRGPYFVILTFGLAELVKYSVVSVEATLGRSSRLLFGTPPLEQVFYAMLVLAALAVLLAYFVRRSRFGRGLIALREDEEAAQTIGVPVVRFKVAAYALSAVIPGMAGGLMALRSTYFQALQVFDPTISFTIVTMAIIGGSDDVRGPLLGAAVLLLLSELLWANAPRLYMILLGLLLVAFVLFAPKGLVGILERRPAAPAE